MFTVYHYPLCPKSRLLRCLLKEQDIEFTLKQIDYWKEKDRILSLDVIGELPVITTPANRNISSLYAIIEYMIELSPNSYHSAASIDERAEMRRIIHWINTRFQSEVIDYIINEKLIKLLTSSDSPRTEFIRASKVNFSHHAKYFQSLISTNGNLVSDNITIADIFLACHLSVLDYFGEVNWDNFQILKEWYAPIKSQPYFRKILTDRIAILKPPPYYENLDF